MKQTEFYFSGSADYTTDKIPLFPEEISGGGSLYALLSIQICWKNAAVNCGNFSFLISNDDENSLVVHTAAIDSEDNSSNVLIYEPQNAASSIQIKYSAASPNDAKIGIVAAYRKLK